MHLHRVAPIGFVVLGLSLVIGCGESQGPTPVPASVTVRPDSVELRLGETEQFGATVLDESGAQISGVAVAFTSSDATVATITPGGLATAVGGGSTNVTASVGAVSGTAHLTVAAPATVIVSPATVTLAIGVQHAFTATVLDGTNNLLPGTPVSFTSSDTTVATTTEDGLVTTVAVGTAVLTAHAGSVSGSALITVLQSGVPALMTVSPNSLDLTVCQTQAVFVTVYDAFGEVLGTPVTFTSDDSTVARASLNGVVTGVGAGSTVMVVAAPPLEDTVSVQVSGPEGVERLCLEYAPFGVAISAQDVMYVSEAYANRLVRFDLPSLERSDSVSVGANPGEVVFAADGQTVYTPDILGTAVSAVDATTNQLATSYDIGETPFRVLPSADGTRLYVASHTGVVHVFDLTDGQVITAISAAADATNGITLSADGSMLYVSSIGGEITEISTNTNTVLRTWHIPGKLQDIALSPDGSIMYVADENGPVKLVDVSSGTVSSTIGGATGGFGLRISPDGSTIVLSRAMHGEILTIDRGSGQITGTYDVGGTPRRIAFDPAGTFFVVANEAGALDIVR